MLATRTLQGIYGSLIIAIAALLASLALASPVAADGDGSSAACETQINLQGNQDVLSYTAPAGQTVTGVCIKSGSGAFGGDKHSPVLAPGYVDSCYSVTLVGQTVTIRRIGSGDGCQGISHVDVIVGSANTGGGGQTPPPSGSTPPPSGSTPPPSGSTPPPSGSTPPPSGSGTLGGSGGPGGSAAAGGGTVVRGAVAGGQGGPAAGSLPNTAVPSELAGSLGGLLVVLSGIGYAVNRRRDN